MFERKERSIFSKCPAHIGSIWICLLRCLKMSNWSEFPSLICITISECAFKWNRRKQISLGYMITASEFPCDCLTPIWSWPLSQCTANGLIMSAIMLQTIHWYSSLTIFSFYCKRRTFLYGTLICCCLSYFNCKGEDVLVCNLGLLLSQLLQL